MDVSETNVPMVFFLKALALIGLFGKQKLRVTMRGNTFSSINDTDSSVDVFKTATLTTIAQIVGLQESFELVITKRDVIDGRVKMTLPFVKNIDNFDFSKSTFIKSINGYICTYSKNTNNIIRNKLNKYFNMCPHNDIYAETLFQSNKKGKKDYQQSKHIIYISLVAETFEGTFITCSEFADYDKINFKEEKVTVDELTEKLTEQFCRQISNKIASGTSYDKEHNIILLIMAALSKGESKIIIDKLDKDYISVFKTNREFTGVKFKFSN